MFEILQEIITLLNEKVKRFPQKFKKEELKDYYLPEERLKLSELLRKIGLFVESILSMETYLVGVIEVNPKKILDDGIRRELIKLIQKMLDSALIFRS